MIEPTLTMIPGPTPVREPILDALSRPTTSHLAPTFLEAFRVCLENLRRIALAGSAQPFVVSGSGTAAMEMALVNLVAPGERLLVLSQGYFGDRWQELARAFGVECELLQADWGRVVPPDDLLGRLERQRYAAVAVTHVDTSTGAAAPVAEYAALLEERPELLLVDGVCATAGVEERFDDWGLDVLLTGAQKALGAPPGVALLLVSERAMERRRKRDSVPAFHADLLRWLPIMEDPGRYFSTPPVNQIVALHRATEIVLEEGLEARFDRHERFARAMRAGLDAIGLQPFTEESCRAATLSVIDYPQGIDDGAFRGAMAARGVIVAGGLGPIAGKSFRIGHMGNIGTGEVCRTLQAVEESLRELGHEVERGAAVAAAGRHL